MENWKFWVFLTGLWQKKEYVLIQRCRKSRLQTQNEQLWVVWGKYLTFLSGSCFWGPDWTKMAKNSTQGWDVSLVKVSAVMLYLQSLTKESTAEHRAAWVRSWNKQICDLGSGLWSVKTFHMAWLAYSSRSLCWLILHSWYKWLPWGLMELMLWQSCMVVAASALTKVMYTVIWCIFLTH